MNSMDCDESSLTLAQGLSESDCSDIASDGRAPVECAVETTEGVMEFTTGDSAPAPVAASLLCPAFPKQIDVG